VHSTDLLVTHPRILVLYVAKWVEMAAELKLSLSSNQP